MRVQRSGGIVSGSVSITNARKKKAECEKVWSTGAKGSPAKRVSEMVMSETTEKAITRSKRRILRTMHKPPMTTMGMSAELPATHQVADWPIVRAASATPNAAGLKTCFLPIARIYFEAIANTDAKTRKPIPEASFHETGEMISARINAVM